MRWFGGFVPSGISGPALRPKGVETIWRANFSLWVSGCWHRGEIVQASSPSRTAAVIGTHRITANALREWMTDGALNSLPCWPGSYTVVVRDQVGITVFTDPAQANPIYHARLAEGAVWASSSRAIAPLVGNTIDVVWLASAITVPAQSASGERSSFGGVLTAPPGHRLQFSPRQPMRTHSWWQPPPRSSRRNASAGFRAALRHAVSVREDAEVGDTSYDLSGGLDSSTLCLLAANQHPRSSTITALTVRPSAVRHGGDLDYARHAVSGRAGILHVVLPLDRNDDPYSRLEAVGPSDEPAPTTITIARHHAAYRRLAANGSGLHVTGDGGDALLMQSADQASVLLSDGKVLRAARDAHGWAKLDKVSPWPRLRALLPGPQGPVVGPVPWSTHRGRGLLTDHRAATVGSSRDADDVVLTEVRAVARTAHADAQLAEPFGILLDAPFTDRTVIDAALCFRPGDRGSPWDYKPQITGSMADLLPRSLLERRAKGGTEADHHRGLRRRLDSVKALADGWLSDNGLIDPGLLRSALTRATSGLPTRFGDLEPTIAAEVWARGVTAAPPLEWSRHRQDAGDVP